MNYLECLAYIESLSPTLERPNLKRMQAFLADQEVARISFPVFHIGGTNGKGSTVAVLDSLLRSMGLRVGRFTGPHLLRWNERFHVNGAPIEDDEFARLATKIRTLSEDFGKRHQELGPLTWFEFLTVIAFVYFAEQTVDIAVLEVGLGGRFDATNVIENPLAAAITSIDLDHTQILGDTIKQIAFEKAGIIKSGSPIVTACSGEAFDVISRQAQERSAPLYQCALPGSVRHIAGSTGSEVTDELWSKMRDEFLAHSREINLIGPHQQLNALVALFCLFLAVRSKNRPFASFDANNLSFVEKALASVYWPGRLQFIVDKGLVMDGAHNPAGARALRQALDERFEGKRRFFVLSCFENKNVSGMLKALITANDRVFVSEPATRRATYPKESLMALCGELGARATCHSTIVSALEAALAERKRDDLIVSTGSFATVRETMNYLGWRCVEDGMTEWVKISSES